MIDPRIHSNRMLALVVALLLGACATPPKTNPLATWVPSPNHNARGPVLIVLHATTQDNVQQSLDTLRSHNRGGPVSAHYLIGRDGARYQLVEDTRRAWHAGVGRWGTISDVNSASIGIELDNDGESPFEDAQIASLLVLLDDLTTRLRIPRSAIIAHADMAPTRKRDPGPLFPWAILAAAGFGMWPATDAPPAPPGFDAWLALASLGYPLDDPAAALRAFRAHFRGIDSDSVLLDIDDMRILHALVHGLGAPFREEAPLPPGEGLGRGFGTR